MTQDPEKQSWHDDVPFPRRWKGYVGVKIVVLVLAVLLALYLLSSMVRAF